MYLDCIFVLFSGRSKSLKGGAFVENFLCHGYDMFSVISNICVLSVKGDHKEVFLWYRFVCTV